MARTLARFDLHEWHNDHEEDARHAIGGSGIPRADLTPFLPRSVKEWASLWATPPNHLIERIQQRLQEAYGFDPKEILLTQGASEADFLAALALAGPEAHVVVEKPAYFALLEPARALGCQVTRVERRPENAFRLDPDDVQRALTKQTRLVVLARPHNPTGERTPDEDLRRIAEDAGRVGAYVLVDEVFAEATKAGDEPARRLHDRILSVNSVTKCLGFGPLHVGWIAAPKTLQEKLHRAKAHTRPLNPTVTLALAERVIAGRRALLARTRARRASNVAALRKFLAGHRHLSCPLQEHGTTAVLRLPGADADDVAFARRLLKETGTLVSPGSFLELPGWIRLGLLSDPMALRKGLDALATAAPPRTDRNVGRQRRVSLSPPT